MAVDGRIGGSWQMRLTPTLIAWSGGQLSARERFASLSPEGRYRVVVTMWLDFPVRDFLDPSVTVAVELRDAASGETLDHVGLGLSEQSDFGDPKVEWRDGGIVTVRRLDQTHDMSVTMNARQWVR
jgi:hypothetical protein